MAVVNFSVILFVCSCLLYSNTLWGSYVWDDRAAIIGNQDVTQENPLIDLFLHDFWGQDIRHNWSHKSYRPITTLSFRANHAMHGMNAAGYHLVNVLIYASGVVLMYIFCKQWTTSKASAKVAGVLYCFHPVHVEAVASLVGRADALCGLFFMATLIVYGKSMRNWTETAKSENRKVGMVQYAFALGLAVAASLSKEIGVTIFGVVVIMEVASSIKERKRIKCAEMHNVKAIQSECIAVAGNDKDRWNMHTFGGSFTGGFYLCFAGLREALLEPFRISQIRSVIVVCTLAALSVLRVYINGPQSLYQWSQLENHIAHLPSFKERCLSYAQTHYWYLMKLLYPRHLCFDYGYACIPTVHVFLDIRNFLPVIAYGMVIMTIYIAIRWVRVPLLIGLSLLIIPLVPALNILFPVGTTLAERLLFIPSAGFCIFVGELLTQLNVVLKVVQQKNCQQKSLKIKKAKVVRHQCDTTTCLNTGFMVTLSQMFCNKHKNAFAFTMIVCAMFSVRVLTRNRDWNSEAQIYASALRVCPLSAKALTNYAVLHMTQEQLHNSVAAGLTSVEVYGQQSPAWLNAGVVQQRLGFQARSVWYYERSLLMNRGSSKTLGYLGGALYEWSSKAADAYSGDVTGSIVGLRKYAAYVLDLSLASGFSPPTILHSRGSLAMDEGDYPTAIKCLEEALRATAVAKEIPDVPHADLVDEAFTLNQLGNSYTSLGRYEDAVRVFARGLEFSPNEVSLLTNQGCALRSTGSLHEARTVLRKAIAAEVNIAGKPSVASLNNLALVEMDAGMYDEAVALYDKALSIYKSAIKDKTLDGVDHKQLRPTFQGGNLGIGEILQINSENARSAQERAKNPARLVL